MKIAMLSAQLSRTGSGVKVVVEELSAALHRLGHEVHVFGLADAYWHEGDQDEWRGSPVSVFETLGPARFGYAPKLEAALRDFAPDILHAHGVWMYSSKVAARVARSGVPNVVSPHGMLDGWALQQSAFLKKIVAAAFERVHLREAHCVHALNTDELNAIRDFGLTGPIAVLPNGANLPITCSGNGELDVAILKSQLSSDAKIMLYLGRIHNKKNLGALISTWEIATEFWHLVIVGPDEDNHRAELEAQISQLPSDVAARIHFLGPLFGAKKSEALALADAFILPSLSEGLPIAVLEAWANRLPVLMTAECNLSIGFIEDAAIKIGTTPQTIAPALVDFMALTEQQQESIGQNGFDLVARSFSWDGVAAQFTELYKWCAVGGTHPTFVNTLEFPK